VDKEVFLRMLSYYEIRSETARPAVRRRMECGSASQCGAKEKAMNFTEC